MSAEPGSTVTVDAQWAHDAQEAFARAELAEAEVAALRALVDQARTWITNCVDPAEVGPEAKQRMLDALHLHPCGHAATVPGCGGCDPGAIESVIEDGGAARPFAPEIDLRLPATVSCDTCGGSGYRLDTIAGRSVPCSHGRR